jgi:hypothetical protein
MYANSPGEREPGLGQPRLLTRLLKRLRMLGPAVAESILISDLSSIDQSENLIFNALTFA